MVKQRVITVDSRDIPEMTQTAVMCEMWNELSKIASSLNKLVGILAKK